MRLSPNNYHQAVNTIRWKPPLPLFVMMRVCDVMRGELKTLSLIMLCCWLQLNCDQEAGYSRSLLYAETWLKRSSKLGCLSDKANNIGSTTKAYLLPCYCGHDLCWLKYVLYIHIGAFIPWHHNITNLWGFVYIIITLPPTWKAELFFTNLVIMLLNKSILLCVKSNTLKVLKNIWSSISLYSKLMSTSYKRRQVYRLRQPNLKELYGGNWFKVIIKLPQYVNRQHKLC